jgi:hypothetical protein
MRIYDYILITLFFGLIIGGCGVWVFTRAKIGTETQLGEKFRAIAAETLRDNHESFLQLAEGRLKQSEILSAATLDKKSIAIDELIKPVRDTLQKMDAQLQALETKREGAYQEVLKAVGLSNEAQQKLREDTGQLLQALRTPSIILPVKMTPAQARCAPSMSCPCPATVAWLSTARFRFRPIWMPRKAKTRM